MMRVRNAVTCVVTLLVISGLITGCAASTPTSSPLPSPSTSAEGAELSGTIVVDAAASLTETFGVIAEDFEKQHPAVTVTLNFGGSSALAESILQGAPVDVFAAASPATMATVTDAELASGPEVFATNSLMIAVPAGNPGDITGLSDFADPDRTIALCAPEVPCGAAALTAFAAAGITAVPDTLEEDVKAALTKVRLGEVDAALVYRTDVLAAGDDVEGIDFARSDEASSDYLIVRVGNSAKPDVATAFVAFVLGEASRRVLSDAGFTTP